MSWKDDRDCLLKAMVKAEGGREAFVRAIRCSIPECQNFDHALQIANTTLDHALWDYAMQQADKGVDFITFLGLRWAPPGAENDPTNLNKNWIPNVVRLYQQKTV